MNGISFLLLQGRREKTLIRDCGKAERKTEHVYFSLHIVIHIESTGVRTKRKRWIIDEENLGRQYDLTSVFVFLSEFNEIMSIKYLTHGRFSINVTY